MCFPGHVKLENTVVMSPGFSSLADEQHLIAADLLAKGKVTLKQLGALYSLYGVWVPCMLQDLVRDFLQFEQISLATNSLKLLSLHTDPFPF